MIIKKLPHWVISNPNPSFYETEGGTVLEQTGVMYKKVQELIDGFNKLVDEINAEIDEFISNTLADQEEFEIKINQMIHDFTTLVDLEIKNHDTLIKDAVAYLKDNLAATVNNEIYRMFETQELRLDFSYNTETESLDVIGMVVTERGDN